MLTFYSAQSMYQREAMWTSFKPEGGSYAVKISVGNVNALTGKPRYTTDAVAKQDYITVNRDNGQLFVLISFHAGSHFSEFVDIGGLWVHIVSLTCRPLTCDRMGSV